MRERNHSILARPVVPLLIGSLLLVASAGLAKNNKSSAGVLRFDNNNYRVAEHAGVAVISVERTRGDDGAVSVAYSATPGSATDGADFQAVSGTLSWADGEAGKKSFTVAILDDFLLEGNETVRLALANVTGGAELHPGHTTALLRIRDDDDFVSEDPPGECGACDGQVSRLTLRYTGTMSDAHVQVTQRIQGEHVVIFDQTVQPGESFEIQGANHKGTLGSTIRVIADGAVNARFHTSCSEPIGPGLARGDFEIVDGFSRNGGPLCPVSGDDGGDDEEPPQDGCEPCDGQVTELTLRYMGDEAAQVRVRQRIQGVQVVIFDELVQPDEPFTIHGQNPNGTLGPVIQIFVEDALHVRIHTSCSEPIGPGLVAGDFEVVDGASRNGGRLCPLDDNGETPSACGACEGQVTQLTLSYLGAEAAAVQVTQRIQNTEVVVFDDLVDPGDPFTINGQNHKGALGSAIRIYVEGRLHVRVHTSCSEPIGPGLVAGDFEVIDGFSRNGGRLCPLAAE